MPATFSALSNRVGPVPGRELALLAVEAAQEKKALDIAVMDMRGVSGEVDYFVICSGQTDVQIRAITESIVEKLKVEAGERPFSREGVPGASRWILLDYFDLAVHIFDPQVRLYYDLERLWGDAPTERVRDDSTSVALLVEGS